MSTDVADLLRESIDRLTEGGRIPDGLAHRAFRRNRQRRVALGAAGLTGTAVAAAAAVFVAAAMTSGVPGRSAGFLRAQTTAYVAGRAERALAAAANGGAIERISVTRRSDTINVVLEEHHGNAIVFRNVPGLNAERTFFWWYRGRQRALALAADGRPVFDMGTVGPAGRRHPGAYALIDYPAKTWLRGFTPTSQPVPLPGLSAKRTCPQPMDPEETVSAPPAAWTAMLRKALSCGDLRLDGRQWVDGVHAIRVVSEPRLVPQLALFTRFSATLWVDPGTFLPVLVRWTWPHGTLAATFQWLRPTPANLAALSLQVPGGFRAVRLARGTGLSLGDTIYVAAMPSATPKPVTPAPTPRS